MPETATYTTSPVTLDENDQVLATSFEHCRRITRTRARNFYYGLKPTPEPKRSALYAIYAFMRACDDMADEPTNDGSAATRSVIESFRLKMDRILTGSEAQQEYTDGAGGFDLLWPAFKHTMTTYPIDPAYMHAMLDGQLRDLDKSDFQTFDQLYDYCYKVASIVGLTCISVWGYSGGEQTRRLAEYRGIAFQLTNILRDLTEDADRNRIYLPTEDLTQHGFTPDTFRAHLLDRTTTPEMTRLIAYQADRAYNYYQRSADLESFIDPRLPTDLARSHADLSGATEQNHPPSRKGPDRTCPISQNPQSRHCLNSITQANMTDRPNTIVIGGGLAGIATAVKLADAGVAVTLVETRKRLGGRATSFTDPTTNQTLDNCQHVLLGCCTNLLNLYKRLGVDHNIQWHDTLYFQDKHGHLDTLQADDLPAPLHLTRSLLTFQGFTLTEKTAIARGMFAIIRTSPLQRDRLHTTSFGDWLSAYSQPPDTIRKFWSPIITSALNETPERVAADLAIHVFQEGFLAANNAYTMGLPAVPLEHLYASAESIIREQGGKLLLGTSAQKLEFHHSQATTLHTSNGTFGDESYQYVNALPFDRLAKIIPDTASQIDPRLNQLNALQVSPIIGIHLWITAEHQPVMTHPHLVLTESPLQWLFNKGIEYNTQHLHAVISAAHDLVDHPPEDLIQLAHNETRIALNLDTTHPNHQLTHARVVKEKRATFSAAPGTNHLRPPTTGPISNLYLAGDWTDTGWPATMEGAVRSGNLAAAAILKQDPPALTPDLPPSPLYNLLSTR